MDFVALKEAAKYAKKFAGKTIVVKLGGGVVEKNIESLAGDIAVLGGFGVGVVVVHGGASQADEASKKLGVQVKKVNGRRVTTPESLEVAKMVFAGKVNTDIVAALQKQGVQAMGLSGIDCGLLEVAKRPAAEVDYGLVADIKKVNASPLKAMLEKGVVPVICSLAAIGGQVYNVNAESIAVEIAASLKAEKLVVLTNVPGLLDNGKLVSYASPSKVRRMIGEGKITAGMHAKITSCLTALEKGVTRTHILDGTQEHALLKELLTGKGSGTMLVSEQELNEYEERG